MISKKRFPMILPVVMVWAALSVAGCVETAVVANRYNSELIRALENV
ncbi:MAG: hypothetical protein LBU28_07740 [Spirochaetaceae bacterium]|jgi:hypothetical protein|nr:hypothetical protein [Spirochaetaceae bacterium]